MTKAKLFCELCGNTFSEIRSIVDTSLFTEMVCPRCNRNGKINDEVWEPTIKHDKRKRKS